MIDIHSHINNRNYEEVEKLIEDMNKHNISQRVVSVVSTDLIKENIVFIEECVKKYSNKLIGCALINPNLYSCVEDIDYVLNSDEIKFIEFNPVLHAYFPDNLQNLDIIMEKISKKPIPVKVFTGIGCYGIPQQWEKFVTKYRNIKFVFLHMGCFDYGYTCIDLVARNRNAYTEISNQYELQILRKALNKIDNNKIIFGSSYPDRLTSSSMIIFDMLEISSNVKDKIYCENAYKLLYGE